MEKHEEKYCPRCNQRFTCKLGDINNCQCSTVELSAETREFLSVAFFDCLCKNCLADLNVRIKGMKPYRFPTQKEMMIEGLHFYKEGGFTVFTELYHLLRRSCCKSGCRHCPYGFKN